MLEQINDFFNIDFTQLLSLVFIFMVGATSVVVVIGNFSEKVLKKPFKWWQRLNRDHKLLEDTIAELKSLSDRHEEDVRQSIAHDVAIKENLDNFMSEMREAINEQKNDIKSFQDNRIHDREQSFRIQKELSDSQKRVAESVDIISQKLDKMKSDTDERFTKNEKKQAENIEKQRENERNKIKDKISSRYSLYHEKQEITDIEFEALRGLIKSYENNGGENSFVHSIVEKEMYAWKRVKK